MVTIRVPCMDPIPEAATLLPELWPDPGEDGNTVIPPSTLATIFVSYALLVNYLEKQHAACAKAAAGTPADR